MATTRKNKPEPKGLGFSPKAESVSALEPVHAEQVRLADAAKLRRLKRALVEIAVVAPNDKELREQLLKVAGAVAKADKRDGATTLKAAAKHDRGGRPTYWTLERSHGFLGHYHALQSSGHYVYEDDVLEELGRLYAMHGKDTVRKRIRRCMTLIAKADTEIAATIRTFTPPKSLRRRRPTDLTK